MSPLRVVPLLYMAMASACRPMATPPPPTTMPTPDATHITRLVARLTEKAPRALTSPTPSPTPPDRPEPLVTGVSRVEAEREVLSWLDPSRSPRIEWSQYVRRSDLSRQGITLLRDQWDVFMDVPVDGLPDPLIVVLASTRGINPIVGATDNPIETVPKS